MIKHRTGNYEKTDEKPKNKMDVFNVWVAIVIYLSLGILLTFGSLIWVRSELKDFFDISYAGYGMLLIVILLVSELWALFIQIPNLRGYDEIIPSWFHIFRLSCGAIILAGIIIFSIVYYVNPMNGSFRLFLAKSVYSLSGHLQKNYVERLAMIDEVIDRGGADAEQFADRGRTYLEIAEIKDDGKEGYKYLLPDDTSEECYKSAIQNFSDAIAQDGDTAEYYYLRGKAEYHNIQWDYSVAKNDFQRAIELDDTVSDYYFYCARTCYEIYINDNNNDEAIQNARDYIDSAIKKYTKKEDGSESDSKAETDDESADELDSTDQDKILAEYYYYAGLINDNRESDESLREAIKNYRNATRYDSENAEYFSRLGVAYYYLDDLTEAERAFDHAVSIDRVDLDYYNEGFHLAWKAFIIEDERIDEAIKIYEESIACRPDYPYSYRRLARLYESKDDDASRKKVYNRAIQNCKDSAEFYFARGDMYYHKENDYNQTIKDMTKVVATDNPYTAEAYYYIGCSYYMLQDYREAYEYYQVAEDKGSKNEIDIYMNDCLAHMEEQ